MTLFAAACAGIMPILHLGRWYYFYWLLPYPNTMQVWPQFRSPLLWDFVALACYIIASIVFWYVGLIPDFASLRDRAATPLGRFGYGALALGWRGASRQWQVYERGYGLLAALMTPLVVSVHSIVGLDFAGGLTPGWHSTQFPPYFVIGALLSGFGIVLVLIVPLRRAYGLEAYITARHLDVLGKLALTFSLLLGYAHLMEAFMPFYGDNPYERAMQVNRFVGAYAGAYWLTLATTVLVPQLLWFSAVRRSPAAAFSIGLVIVIGMWIERYVLVVTSLYRDFMPSAWGHFAGTVWDWATLIGSIGIFLGGILVALRLVPAVSLAELRQLIAQRTAPP
jgi:molybdopterin-containing oxidoreductase family membrane subunit